MLVLGLVVLVTMAGCKSSRKKAGGMGDYDSDNPYGVSGSSDLYGEPMLGDERMVGTEYAAGEFVPVYFGYDSSRVDAAERMKIEEIAERLRRDRTGGVIIEGHCDERGSSEYNLALGERRAQAVRSYLVGLGIDPARIQTKSYGEEKPAMMGHDEGAWSKNRRAEFIFYQ